MLLSILIRLQLQIVTAVIHMHSLTECQMFLLRT